MLRFQKRAVVLVTIVAFVLPMLVLYGVILDQPRRATVVHSLTAAAQSVVNVVDAPASPEQTALPRTSDSPSGDKYRYEEELVGLLSNRLQMFHEDRWDWMAVTCDTVNHTFKTCYEPNCPGKFSTSLRDRVHQILATRSDATAKYRPIMTSAAQNVTSHKYILATAVSSNHYREMQGLVDNVHKVLLPKMAGHDYIFVLFDIGLNPDQRKLTEKNCRCLVLDFPFSHLPKYFTELFCYTWKPIIIASLLPKAEYLVWMDASIRFADTTPLDAIFQRCKERGYQTSHNGGSIAVRTAQTMATFYGDQLCQYSPFDETEANLGFFYNDRFTHELILEPWLSCAFNETCMCIPEHSSFLNCYSSPPRQYGRCHRFDQSSLGILLTKLYLDHRPMVYLPPEHATTVLRGHQMDWFT